MRSRFYLLLALVTFVLAACANAIEAPSPNETVPTDRTQPSTREVDFSQVPEIRQALSQCTLDWRFQGTTSSLDLSPCRISAVSYQDLGGDGREEAIIEIAGLSGMGRQPVLSVFVFGYEESTLRLLVVQDTRTGPLWTYILDGKLAIGETLYGPSEPACCPSKSTLSIYGYGPAGPRRETFETVSCQSTHDVVGTVMCPRP